MRVALLSRAAYPLHAPGGLERAVYYTAKHLRERGVDTVLITREATRQGSFPGDVVTVPYGTGRDAAHGRVLDRTLHYPRFAVRLGEVAAEMVRQGRVDVVHAQGLTALGYGRLRQRDPGLTAPLVMNPQGMEEHKAGGMKRLALARLRTLSREAARLADRVIATDDATRDEVQHLLGVPRARVVVLPNGIDEDEIRGATPADPEGVAHEAIPALAGAFPVFLSAGRMEAYKGFGDILQALLRLQGSLPPRWAWVAVGEGPQRGRLAWTVALRRVARTALPKRGADARWEVRHVHLPGSVSEPLLHALYERADVFVHATRYEGSSLVTLEAMAHGLPVIATRAGGIPDKVSDETGRLVAPGDVAGLARAMSELAEDAALREAMGRHGRERVRERFSWPAIARRTVDLFEELVRARRA